MSLVKGKSDHILPSLKPSLALKTKSKLLSLCNKVLLFLGACLPFQAFASFATYYLIFKKAIQLPSEPYSHIPEPYSLSCEYSWMIYFLSGIILSLPTFPFSWWTLNYLQLKHHDPKRRYFHSRTVPEPSYERYANLPCPATFHTLLLVFPNVIVCVSSGTMNPV